MLLFNIYPLQKKTVLLIVLYSGIEKFLVFMQSLRICGALKGSLRSKLTNRICHRSYNTEFTVCSIKCKAADNIFDFGHFIATVGSNRTTVARSILRN